MPGGVVISCIECGHARPPMIPVADQWLCQPCAQQVRDVMALAAVMNMSVYDLAAAVFDG